LAVVEAFDIDEHVGPCGMTGSVGLALRRSFIGVLNNILAESVVDAGLITLAILDVRLKPVNQIGIEAQSQLLFDRAEEKAASRAAPITLFWHLARVDLIVGHRGQSLKLRFLSCG
jgi:hypothetical protein